MAKVSEEKGENQSNIEAAQEAAAEQFKILTGTNDQFKPTFEDKLKAYEKVMEIAKAYNLTRNEIIGGTKWTSEEERNWIVFDKRREKREEEAQKVAAITPPVAQEGEIEGRGWQEALQGKINGEIDRLFEGVTKYDDKTVKELAQKISKVLSDTRIEQPDNPEAYWQKVIRQEAREGQVKMSLTQRIKGAVESFVNKVEKAFDNEHKSHLEKLVEKNPQVKDLVKHLEEGVINTKGLNKGDGQSKNAGRGK